MVTVFLRGGLSISALVHQAQFEQSCYQQAFQEPYDGNRQQLYFVPHLIQKVEWNVLHDGHRLLEMRQSLLQLFGQSKQPSRRWLHTFLLLESCWMHWVRHETACAQGTYVVCSNKGIQWCWGTYLLRGKIKRLVVEWTGMLVEFRQSYDDFDCFISYGGRLEPRMSLYSAVQTRHNLETTRETRRNGEYIWVLETSTWQLDQSLQILQASLLPFIPFLRNITLKNMEKQLPWGNRKSTIKRFQWRSSSLFVGLLMPFSTLESLCFVWTVGCGNVILSSVHGRLTTSKTFTCIQSSSPIALCAKHRNRRLDNGIHRLGNWETIGYTPKNRYSRLREMRWRDGKQDNIWKIKQLEPQKVSSGIWNASLRQLLLYPIFFIPSILVCFSIWWTG